LASKWSRPAFDISWSVFFFDGHFYFFDFFSGWKKERERERHDRNPPPSLLNGSDLLTRCLDMSRFSFSSPIQKLLLVSIQHTDIHIREENKASAEGERDVGGGPRIGGDGLSPAILYTPSKNRRRKFSLFYFFSSFPRPFKVGKLLLA
jgi:hypothetical protein